MTEKQFHIAEFYRLLEQYKVALTTGRNIIVASLQIHAAKSYVPKRLWPLVNRVFRHTRTKNI